MFSKKSVFTIFVLIDPDTILKLKNYDIVPSKYAII